MNTATLLKTLVDIERALQRTDYIEARFLVLCAQEHVLQLDRDMISLQSEVLREAA